MDKLDQISDNANGSMSDLDNRPSPTDFIAFIPWACGQLQVNENIIVKKVVQNDYVGVTIKGKMKNKLKQSAVMEDLASDQNVVKSDVPIAMAPEDTVIILAVYSNDHLVQIKFERNVSIPRIILRIIELIIKFHSYVHTITITSGLDKYTIYELSKIVSLCQNLTDICLDGTSVREANYYLILEQPNQLRNLSLARCRIDDRIVKTIAEKLIYPAPASKVLNLLNLSSNEISNIGAAALSEVLRSNKRLYYLNLANNRITDVGCKAILSTLVEFHLSVDEMLAMRRSHLTHLKKKRDLVYQLIQDMVTEADSKKSKTMKKDFTATSKKGKVTPKDAAAKTAPNAVNNNTIELVDPLMYQKAEYLAEQHLGQFIHPYSQANTISKNGLLYSKGNNTLCYLNMSYNNLSYITLKRLLTVLEYQASVGRKPVGLLMVSIEGNPMPPQCDEMRKLESCLQAGINVEGRGTFGKARQSIKGRL